MTPAGSRGASVHLDDVRFAYGAAAMRFDLTIEAGQRVAIMGPSGSGKSTLLNLVAGFEAPAQGRIVIGGRDATADPPHLRPVSMVFQENNLFSHLDVFANVALGRSAKLRLNERDRTDVMSAIARTGLAGKDKRRPAELSGGERQRVALARILLRDRPVLLLDEALASLDRALRNEMTDLLAALHEERGTTLLMVTHDREDALRLCERTLLLEAGSIAADGATADILG